MISQENFERLLIEMGKLPYDNLNRLRNEVNREWTEREKIAESKPKSIQEMIDRTLQTEDCQGEFCWERRDNDKETLMRSDINPHYLETIRRTLREKDNVFEYEGEVWNIRKTERWTSGSHWNPAILTEVRFFVKKSKVVKL